MQMDLQGKNALVTGSSRGIGRAIAVELAKAGANVALHYRENDKAAQEVQQEIRELGRETLLLRACLSDEAAIVQMYQQLLNEWQKLDILVANAGMTRDIPFLRMKTEDFDKVIEINLRGTFICLREAGKIMTKARYGRIVTISSVAGLMGNVGQANYSASKAGLIALTKSLARECARRDIVANVVAPGLIDTEITQNLSDKAQERILSIVPKRRMGTKEEVADMVVFLASDQARYITGQVFSVNGGMLM